MWVLTPSTSSTETAEAAPEGQPPTPALPGTQRGWHRSLPGHFGLRRRPLTLSSTSLGAFSCLSSADMEQFSKAIF